MTTTNRWGLLRGNKPKKWKKSLEIILETFHWSLNAGGDEKKKRKAGVFDESSEDEAEPEREPMEENRDRHPAGVTDEDIFGGSASSSDSDAEKNEAAEAKATVSSAPSASDDVFRDLNDDDSQAVAARPPSPTRINMRFEEEGFLKGEKKWQIY
ncbi:uncharacterized protein [Oscarella lobularis]|uniref:uncharacterized protein isoform X3 n=1 Tax=Oscarella lobularis TaxID=121494 RepID=UPI0033137A44